MSGDCCVSSTVLNSTDKMVERTHLVLALLALTMETAQLTGPVQCSAGRPEAQRRSHGTCSRQGGRPSLEVSSLRALETGEKEVQSDCRAGSGQGGGR